MNHKYRRLLGLFAGAALALGAAGTARAQGTDAILDLLLRKGIINEREMKQLKEEADADLARMMARQNKAKVNSWVDALKWSGDLRLRTEYFDNGDQLKPYGDDATDRWRFRYRLRLQLEAAFVDWAKVTARLASGPTDDPVSTNQTLTDTFRNKSITIDTAFVTLQPPGWDWLTVYAGKMNNALWQPGFNSPLLYDGDVTPEGVAETVQWQFGPDKRHAFFAQAGQYAVKEISGNSNDAYLYDFQGGFDWKFGKDPKKPRVRLQAAGGYMLTHNVAADQPNTGVRVGDSPNLGNTVFISGSTTNFFDEFEVAYVRGQLAWLVSEKPFFGTPALLTFSGEYVRNLADDDLKNAPGSYLGKADDYTMGWTLQAKFGDARKKGQWEVAYQYKHLEANAVWDAITDSDWGTGGTDRKGHVVKAAYNPQDWWQLGVGVFLTEKISKWANSGHNMIGSIPPENNDLLRIQMDSSFKF